MDPNTFHSSPFFLYADMAKSAMGSTNEGEAAVVVNRPLRQQ